VRIVRAVSSSRSCSGDLAPLSPEDRAPDPPAQRHRKLFVWPYFLRRRVASVSCRRDSADERFAIEEERSRRRRAVEESIESRSSSVRCLRCCPARREEEEEMEGVRRW